MRRGESGGAVPRRFLRFRWNVPHAALFAHALFYCRQSAFFSRPSGGPISSSSGRNGGKNAAKNQWFLEFLSSDHSHAAKRPTPNRSCPYPRCRFHVPQENAVSYRRGTVYLRVVRRSGSDKRTARDSLYDDVRQFKSRVVRGGGFQRTPAAQEVLKPAVSSSVFGHFWGCGQK